MSTFANAISVPVGIPDRITLTELAHELRKLFDFKYLTVDNLCPRGGGLEIAIGGRNARIRRI